MSAPAGMPGLSTDQGPPLSIPLSFFGTAPLAVIAAGALLLGRADDGIVTAFAPSNVALVHLGALGFLVLVSAGSLYQLLPVVAGALVPAVRLAHLVHALLGLGAATLALSQWRVVPQGFTLGAVLVAAGLALWLGPSAIALGRSAVGHPTARGLRLALAALGLVAAFGVRLALARSGAWPLTGEWLTWKAAHAATGLLLFQGTLVAAVSWQVVPMFFLAPAPPAWLPRVVQLTVGLALVALPVIVLAELPATWVTWASTPAALALLGLQPAWIARALLARKRRRRDATLYGWWGALGLAPFVAALGVVTGLSHDPTAPLLLGLLVLWGQVGLVAHAMLTRIVPFLVYLHRSAPLVLTHRMRSSKELLPDREVALGAALHLASLGLGVAAALASSMALWRAFGASLVVVGGYLGYELVVTFRRGVTPLGPRAPQGTQ